jgi:hypothetical protein
MIDQALFWSSRPVLEHILKLARSRRVGPWAVLGTAMTHAVAGIPTHVAIPAIVGGRMSLNLFVALVGPSGGGKGGAESAGTSGIKIGGSSIESVPLGSGEGASRTFRTAGTAEGARNTITSAIFTVPEVDTLTALIGRQGSTLSAELRKMYSGEALGFANAGKETRNMVPPHSYRACLMIGVQPLRSHSLIGASDGGLPQRFVWLPTFDPDAPDKRPPDPGVFEIPALVWPSRPVGHLRLVDDDADVSVPETARVAIDSNRLAVLRQETNVNPLDGHALLCRLKAAVALMALDARTNLNDDDWTLAEQVMAVSEHTYTLCLNSLRHHRRNQNTAHALASDERDEIVADRKCQRARDAILRKLSGSQQLTSGELRRALKVDIRSYYDAAITELLDMQQIGASIAKRGNHEVHVYYRYIDDDSQVSGVDSACTRGTPVLGARIGQQSVALQPTATTLVNRR